MLIFNGTNITAWYHFAGKRPQQPWDKEIVFPNASGRARLHIGDSAPGGAEVFVFSESGIKRNRLYSTTINSIRQVQAALEAYYKTSTIGTLQYTDIGGVVQEAFVKILTYSTVGDIIKTVSPTTYQQVFQISFVRVA